jgi:transcriptional regulator with XRE-family HTH domain
MIYASARVVIKLLTMNLVTVDPSGLNAKNLGMTDDERNRVGRKLRAMRVERGLHQTQVARKAGLGIGTLQAIEGAWRVVRDSNLEKLATFYGTTVMKVLRADEPKVLTPNNPMLRGLNEEHLEIAQGYKDARKRVRACIELLLESPDEEHLPNVVLQLATLEPDVLQHLRAFIATSPDIGTIDLATRLQQAPPEARHLVLDSLDQLTTKATTEAPKKPAIKPGKKP